MPVLTIEIQDAALRAAMKALEERALDLRPAMTEIGAYLQETHP
jgi:hypothetical protein